MKQKKDKIEYAPNGLAQLDGHHLIGESRDFELRAGIGRAVLCKKIGLQEELPGDSFEN